MILSSFPQSAEYPYLVAFFLLLVGHALSDFPLQTDFMVRAKSPRAGSIWPWVLGSHSLIHGFAVAVILGNFWLGLAEFIAHFIIDLCKSLGLFGKGDISFHIDQTFHFICKAAWVYIAFNLL